MELTELYIKLYEGVINNLIICSTLFVDEIINSFHYDGVDNAIPRNHQLEKRAA